MAVSDQSENVFLRAENVSSVIKAIALQEFKFKQLLMENTSSAWIETYYRETNTELTGGTANNVRGIPRLSSFPNADPSWSKYSSYIEKYGCEASISIEDELQNNIPTMARTMLKVARAIANAIDTQIYNALVTEAGNSISISGTNTWDNATLANRDPILDILRAKKEIENDNLDPDKNGYLVVNPYDYMYLLSNSKVINSPTFKGADVVQNGVVGQLAGLKIIKSNVVAVSGALVVIAKECGNWASAKGVEVITIKDPGVKTTIRGFELGTVQITTPSAICKITGTATGS